jgi:hypothetical protein
MAILIAHLAPNGPDIVVHAGQIALKSATTSDAELEDWDNIPDECHLVDEGRCLKYFR